MTFLGIGIGQNHLCLQMILEHNLLHRGLDKIFLKCFFLVVGFTGLED
jgi:hypothetical protein